MNLSPAPFGGPGEADVILRAPVQQAPAQKMMVGPDRTECNYLVMFFVLGVFLLALMDSM
jgi:hypothetical protein